MNQLRQFFFEDGMFYGWLGIKRRFIYKKKRHPLETLSQPFIWQVKYRRTLIFIFIFKLSSVIYFTLLNFTFPSFIIVSLHASFFYTGKTIIIYLWGVVDFYNSLYRVFFILFYLGIFFYMRIFFYPRILSLSFLLFSFYLGLLFIG